MDGLTNLTEDVSVSSGWSDDQSIGSDDIVGMSSNLFQSTESVVARMIWRCC
uniref:Uncharacterized protein n=1 Tax=Globisporangium ultimum (strain ATCC 200006 / CBS 805.95 / DAOM BR144) TaxID=431595 RepID=K3WP82_GLOUD